MKPKVIFHIDRMKKWELLLDNVSNLIKSYDSASSDIVIAVLANSEAVKGYLKDDDKNELSTMLNLSQQGVRFVACNNALQGLKITQGQIPNHVDIVPAGVRELVERQTEGYAYIKP